MRTYLEETSAMTNLNEDCVGWPRVESESAMFDPDLRVGSRDQTRAKRGKFLSP